MARPFVLTLALLLTAPAEAQQVTVDRTFQTASSGWTGGMPGRFLVAWRPVEIGGVPHVCGAYSVTNAQLRPVVDRMLREGGVAAGGQPVLRGLRFWNRVGRATNDEAMLGQTATCAPLPAAAAGRDDISVFFGRGSYRN